MGTTTSARGRDGNRLRNLRRNLAHTAGTNAVMARLYRDAASAGHPRPLWRSEAESSIRFEYRNREYWVRPDASGIYYVGDRSRWFMLEYDRGTMRRRDYRRKLVGIAAFFLDGEDLRYGRGVVVLVVSESDDGERRFAEVAVEIEEKFPWYRELPILLTTRQRFDSNFRGVHGAIWRTPRDSARRAWLDDGSATPTDEA